MSPRRKVRRNHVVRRTGRDYVLALLAVVAVAAGSVLTIWLIRPSGPASNQPRIATVLSVTVAAFIITVLIARTPDRPVVGRLTLWGSVVIAAVLCVSAGAIVAELGDVSWALAAGIWTGVAIIAIAAFGECALLVRHWSQGSPVLALVLSLALALLCGAATSLIWMGDLYITRVTPDTVPLVPDVPQPPDVPPGSPATGITVAPPVSSTTP
jgi:hypothetical protein